MSGVVFMVVSTVAAAQVQLSFQEALAAVPTSPRVAVARTEVELARKQLDVTASFLQSNLSGGYTRTFSNLTTNGVTSYDAGGNLDPLQLTTALNLVPYGPFEDRVVRGRWALQRAEAALQDETAAVVISVTEQYQNALRAEQNVSVARAQLELAQAQLGAARVGFAAGTTTTSGVTGAELSARQSEQDVEIALTTQAQALAALSVTLGRTVDALAGGVPDNAAPGLLAETNDKTTDALLARRSDLLSAALNVAEAELTAAATLRDNLPSGTLSAAYTNGSDGSSLQLGAQFSTGGPNAYQPTLSAGIDPDSGLPGLAPGQVSSAFSVGLGLNIPLNAALDAALEAARLNVDTARLRGAQTLALARLEVANRAADVTAAEAQADLARQVLAQRRESSRVARQRFELGLLPQLEVRSAAVTALEAELALHRAEDAVRLAYMRYAAALGDDPREVF